MNGHPSASQDTRQANSRSSDRAMEPEQFRQVLDAIHAGKYSWACFLLLRFSNYNPLHYIPYRTYNRLVKNNHSRIGAGQPNSDPVNTTASHSANLKIVQDVQDLSYLDAVPERAAQVKGGHRFLWGWWPW
jgi:penicillin-binding protein-related factor A (putative recombinase)